MVAEGFVALRFLFYLTMFDNNNAISITLSVSRVFPFSCNSPSYISRIIRSRIEDLSQFDYVYLRINVNNKIICAFAICLA